MDGTATAVPLQIKQPTPGAELDELDPACHNGRDGGNPLADVSVQFIGARSLPKMDMLGTADPYFVATIDDKIKFTSAVQPKTQNPVWNELWHVKNVPSDGKLRVTVYDKDDVTPQDDYIGVCELDLEEGTKEVTIEGSRKRERGTLWVKVTRSPASSASLPLYTFDGPVSYSRHSSPTLGLLTQLDDEHGKHLFSTWNVHIKGVPAFLGAAQHWNTAYSGAQRIFGTGPAALALRSSIQAAHRLLYARSTRNAFGTLGGAADVCALLAGAGPARSRARTAPPSPRLSPTPSLSRLASPVPSTSTSTSTSTSPLSPALSPSRRRRRRHRVKPALYTYVICGDDDTLRFSETGAAFVVDFASKHALHANCAETVRYAGEFHLRPARGGWAALEARERERAWAKGRDDGPAPDPDSDDSDAETEDEWELVIDNNSGTYAPDNALLPRLQELLAFNFPGLGVVALDRKDPELERSREACLAYALRYRAEAKKDHNVCDTSMDLGLNFRHLT